MEDKGEKGKRLVGYSKKVLKYFFNPVNVGEIEDPDVISRAGSPACGDMIKMYIKFDGDMIKDIKFRSYGCASNIATASILTEMVKGKSIKEARKYTFSSVVEELGGLPRIKYHCAVLAVTALKIALDKWDVKRGLRKFDESLVREILSAVIDPETGESVLPNVKSISLRGNSLLLEISMEDPESRGIIEEQVRDSFSDLPVRVDIKWIS